MIIDILKSIIKNFQLFLVIWAVIIIGNQVFIFGACFAPYCILAALPHTGIISALLTFLWIKDTQDSFNQEHNEELQRDKKNRASLKRRIKELEKSLDEGSKTKVSLLHSEEERELEAGTKSLSSDLESEEVFITRANEAKILSSSNYQADNDNFNELYNQSLEFILSKPELRLLKVYKNICEDPSKILDAYIKIETVDSKIYVWEGSKPAYHFDKYCPRLNAEFTNLLIPEEVKHRGDNAIEKFRTFVKENKDLLERDETKFLNKLESRFALKNPPKSLKFNNSGIKNIENYSLEKLKETIDSLIHEAKEFSNKDSYTSDLIRKLGYGTHKIKQAKELDNPLYTWHQYKVDLKNLLRQYYRVKFNHELKFEKSLLEQIGFNPCEYCNDDNSIKC